MEAIQQALSRGTLILDVRSEKEFRLGAIPGAINMPILTDDERHLVGTTYKQKNSQEALALGLELFAARAEAYLEQFIGATANGEILVYCWRGGMRSELSLRWLRASGLRVNKLAGGYKAFRQLVLASIEQGTREKNFLVLNGQTGVGKTELIHAAAERSLPCLDFEAMARHRGSLFGGLAQPLPPATQQEFENQLALAFHQLSSAPTIVVEIEGAIGPVVLPLPLQRKMRASPMIYLESSLEERLQRLLRIYTPKWSAPTAAAFMAGLQQCRRFLSQEVYKQICTNIAAKDLAGAARLLLLHRYDKAYQKGLDKHKSSCIAQFTVPEQKEAFFRFLETSLVL